MNEWILIMAINLKGLQGEIRDISVETISGFNSERSCRESYKNIAYKLIIIIRRARNQQGIPAGKKSMPSINGDCILIEK